MLGAILCAITAVLASPVFADQITTFNAEDERLSFTFAAGGETYPFYIKIPQGIITDARMRITGLNYEESEPAHVDVALVTDTSLSMADENKLDSAKEAASSFVKLVDFELVQVGLVEYSGCPTLSEVLPLTDNLNDLLLEIGSYIPVSMTNTGKGMKLAIDELLSERAQDNANKVMVLMTDGLPNQYYNETTGSCPIGEYSVPKSKEYAIQMAQRAKDNNIMIYSIGFGSDADTDLLKNIAAITGGKYYYAPTGNQLKEIYEAIASQISKQRFPTPMIGRPKDPNYEISWNTTIAYKEAGLWSGSDCGSAVAECHSLTQVLQSYVDECLTPECQVQFSVSSSSAGQLNLSDLFISTTLQGTIVINKTAVGGDDEFTFEGLGGDFPIQTIEGQGNKTFTNIIPGTYIVSEYPMSGWDLTGLECLDPNHNTVLNDNTATINLDPGETVTCSFTNTKLGTIDCNPEKVQVLLTYGEIKTIPITQVFQFEGQTGNILDLLEDSSSDIAVTKNLPDSFGVEPTGLSGIEEFSVTITTDYSIQSPPCPVKFLALRGPNDEEDDEEDEDDDENGFDSNFNCGSANSNCKDCSDYDCLYNNDCLGKTIKVFNPLVSVQVPNLLGTPLPSYSVSEFSPLDSLFTISPTSGQKWQIFDISGQNAPDETKSAANLYLSFDGFEGTYRICPELHRIDKTIGSDPEEIETDLLVASPGLIAGYYEQSGRIRSTGPYIFTAKVWLRG